jgi:hypothetical protein
MAAIEHTIHYYVGEVLALGVEDETSVSGSL